MRGVPVQLAQTAARQCSYRLSPDDLFFFCACPTCGTVSKAGKKIKKFRFRFTLTSPTFSLKIHGSDSHSLPSTPFDTDSDPDSLCPKSRDSESDSESPPKWRDSNSPARIIGFVDRALSHAHPVVAVGREVDRRVLLSGTAKTPERGARRYSGRSGRPLFSPRRQARAIHSRIHSSRAFRPRPPRRRAGRAPRRRRAAPRAAAPGLLALLLPRAAGAQHSHAVRDSRTSDRSARGGRGAGRAAPRRRARCRRPRASVCFRRRRGGPSRYAGGAGRPPRAPAKLCGQFPIGARRRRTPGGSVDRRRRGRGMEPLGGRAVACALGWRERRG